MTEENSANQQLVDSRLQVLYLQYNQLQCLPDYLENFGALTKLDISG